MKILGIIGGLGPESTVDYYRFIIEEYRRRTHTNASPPMLINSLDIEKGIALVTANNLVELAAYIGEGLQRLARAGADFALMAANTPHIAFDAIQRLSPIPLLSIVEATRDEAQKLGMKRLALLGTGFTMRGRFYPDVFSRAGIELITPSEDEKSFIHEKYLGELLTNQFLPATRDRMMKIIERLAAGGAAGVIMAGTELPLLLRDSKPPVPFLDTTLIHVNAAVDEMLKT
ncbi:MAG TPA: amino acid racemase [Terriglobia bacterium]|nr:amino acid racemase [Terriglobia bacterium]